MIGVTGAGHGIGRELALQLSRLGAKVVCCDINEAWNNSTVEAIRAEAGVAWGYNCDVSSRSSVHDVALMVGALWRHVAYGCMCGNHISERALYVLRVNNVPGTEIYEMQSSWHNFSLMQGWELHEDSSVRFLILEIFRYISSYFYDVCCSSVSVLL
ncbi:Short-chain dehydrogenase/reductase SDR [Trinorchestia longiramus]|nr:Short-chain dehydrogenase/reductase SDR [Trinorchestia longiramus]